MNIKPRRGMLRARRFLVDDNGDPYYPGDKGETVTAAGIIVPDIHNANHDTFAADMFVVLSMGDDPDEDPKNLPKRDRRYRWTWEGQDVTPGTPIMVRSQSGISQHTTASETYFHWFEVACIGQPEDSAEPMLPAPGWVLLKEARAEEDEYGHARAAGIIIPNAETAGRLEDSETLWCTVAGVPRGWEGRYPVRVGDRVAVPYSTAAGATEFIRADDGVRVVPVMDLLCVDEAEAA